MSLFKKMFGSNPEALLEKADGLFDGGDFGSAKLTYEKALGQLDESRKADAIQKIEACCDGIAAKRLKEAAKYKAAGQLDLASAELVGAQEVAVAADLLQQIRAAFDSLEEEDALEQAETQHITDEERLALIIGQWGDAQADEYDNYGEAIFSALLALSKEEYMEGRDQLEAIALSAKSPCYLWLDLGRSRLLGGDVEAGAEALESFLSKLPAGEGADARLSAHVELARIADDAGDVDRAMTEFGRAIENLPNDYRAYLAMGAYLRQKEHATEAIDVLNTAKEVASTTEGDWRLMQELGLAYADNLQANEAIGHLEQVIEFFSSYQEHDYPTTTALPLAKLHEAGGRLERAADLYRSMCEGSDRDNHGVYHREAGRLLGRFGLDEEAYRMLTRARALGENDAALLATIDKELELLAN